MGKYYGSHEAYLHYRRLLEERVLADQAQKGNDMDVSSLRQVSDGKGRTQMDLDEARWTLLYYISKSRSIPEMSKAVGRSLSTVHEMLEKLRDEGYIEPWVPNMARSKKLTERGQEWVLDGYRDGISRTKKRIQD